MDDKQIKELCKLIKRHDNAVDEASQRNWDKISYNKIVDVAARALFKFVIGRNPTATEMIRCQE